MLIYSEMCLIGHRWFSVKKVRTLSPEWAANCSTDNIAFCLRKFIRSNVYFRMKIWKPRAYLDPLVHPPWEGGFCIPGLSYVHILRKLLTRMLQRPKLSEVKTGRGRGIWASLVKTITFLLFRLFSFIACINLCLVPFVNHHIFQLYDKCLFDCNTQGNFNRLNCPKTCKNRNTPILIVSHIRSLISDNSLSR